jgi:glyoxylase-like metal-dependent hydrolase (beta-lactamase superfamily II)
MIQIFPLSEGEFTVGHDKIMIPFDPTKQDLLSRSTGSLHIEVQPFLVVTSQDLIVLDTGLGYRNAAGVLQIHQNIIDAGYEPGAVTKVLQSHLHKDHCGGMTFKSDNGLVLPTFPNATYYLYRPEVAYALEKGMPSYFPHEIEETIKVAHVEWLDGPGNEIGNGVRFEHTGGHCPQHIVWMITDGGETCFFGGDEAPQLKQMQIRYVAKYDYDGKKALAIREKFGAIGRAEGWNFLFYHDVKTAVSRLV